MDFLGNAAVVGAGEEGGDDVNGGNVGKERDYGQGVVAVEGVVVEVAPVAED